MTYQSELFENDAVIAYEGILEMLTRRTGHATDGDKVAAAIILALRHFDERAGDNSPYWARE